MDSSNTPTPPAPQPRGNSFDLYSEITKQIMAMLEKGVVPWRSPILSRSTAGHPKNLNTGRPYRGVNVFLLAFTAYMKGYESSYWLTYDQARGRGGAVKKGEKSSQVVFWKPMEVVDEETKEKKKVFVLRYYNVFNVDQCDGIEKPDAPKFTPSEVKPIEAAERIVKGYADGPAIEHKGSQAYYRPLSDAICIPEPARFQNTELYFATLFHELSHSTGHSKRLDRKLDKDLRPFGSPDYGKEELVAEMSAAFLCGEAGIVPAVIENQSGYISGWLGTLKSDKRLVIHAAGAAARAADWILGRRSGSDMSGEGSSPNAPGNDGHSSEKESRNPPMIVMRESPRDKILRDAAQEYLRQGYAPIPILAGQKGPDYPDWQNLRLEERDLFEAFRGYGNIGLLLGAPSGHLVDVDLDCEEARQLADRLLPPTDAVTGRPGSPRSHRWYICPGLQTTQRRDPLTRKSIIEARSTGAQTLVGPSIHPSGEPYDPLHARPEAISSEELLSAVNNLADQVLIARYGAIPERPEKEEAKRAEPPHIPANRQHLLRRASAYLGAIPPAISGQGGHNLTYAAATALVHGFTLTPEEALALLQQHYNPRCQPPWSDKELLHKVTDAATSPHEKEYGWLLKAP
ncbi:MAG TPA: zincin-like metallopeptidase domain-containing protein [Phycisphaerae bacterium]|nr:zincin-like metallopeptidase domain-containing protein [Phycisphaerae bacterium]